MISEDRVRLGRQLARKASEPEFALSEAELQQLSRAYFEHRLWGAPPDYVAPILRDDEVQLPENLSGVITILELAEAG